MHISPFLLVAALGSSVFGKNTKGSCTCSNAALEQCLKTKGVPFKVRCDSDWAQYNTTMNLRLPVSPAVVVVPDNSRHVSAAVICAGRSGVKAQAKSGGRTLLCLPLLSARLHVPIADTTHEQIRMGHTVPGVASTARSRSISATSTRLSCPQTGPTSP